MSSPASSRTLSSPLLHAPPFLAPGDMLRDLEKELSSYAAERQRKRATAAGGGAASAPKSLWEELFDIGEEFVEFLEQVGLPSREGFM